MLWPASPLLTWQRMATKTTNPAASEETPAVPEKDIEAEWSEEGEEFDPKLPPRRDLLVEAIRIVRAALVDEKPPTRTTVGNLVQLLKLHKDLIREEETPTHIQLIWNEVDEALYGDD